MNESVVEDVYQFMKTLLLVIILTLFIPYELFAQDDSRAREIFDTFDERRRAITYETSTLQMLIIDSRERVRTRVMRMQSVNRDRVSKSLTVFQEPADVRGTGFLSISEGGTEVQYLFLPALGRVQSITGNQRSDRFMGSDFTFEDLGAIEPEQMEVTVLEEHETTMLIKAIPTGSSQYSVIHYKIDTERYILLEAFYFDRDGRQIKHLTATDYNEVRPGVWRPDTMIMRDLIQNRRTELRWNERIFDEPIPDRIFSERNLSRGVQ